MITIINYGLGNVRAFANLYKRMNVPVAIATRAADLEGASKLILPGVGAFDHAMELLDGSGMRATLDEMVLRRAIPVLGVCVGMQILAGSSDEGRLAGLGWINGRVRRFDEATLRQPSRLPHMGWNTVDAPADSELFAGLGPERFYFVHSYAARSWSLDVRPPFPSPRLTWATHGAPFLAAVENGPLSATQFHPEKSGPAGIQLLRNWLGTLR